VPQATAIGTPGQERDRSPGIEPPDRLAGGKLADLDHTRGIPQGQPTAVGTQADRAAAGARGPFEGDATDEVEQEAVTARGGAEEMLSFLREREVIGTIREPRGEDRDRCQAAPVRGADAGRPSS
jgi:hypothetical protein